MVRASSVAYENGGIIIALSNGESLSFAPSELQGLEAATPEQLTDVEIYPGGLGLHWVALNECFMVAGLIEGRTGSKAWMAKQASAA